MIVDIPGSFLQTDDTSCETHICLDGIMEYLLGKFNPDPYQKFISIDEK